MCGCVYAICFVKISIDIELRARNYVVELSVFSCSSSITDVKKRVFQVL